MDIAFDQVQEDFRAEVRKFMTRTSTSAQVRALMDSETGFDADLWSRMSSQLEVQSLIIPEKFGGTGATLVELAIVIEEAGRVLHSSPLLSSAALATVAILASGDESAMDRLLPSLADGSAIATLAVVERDGPWSAQIATTAIEVADGYSLTGQKTVVLDAGVAGMFIVSARSPAGPGLFLVSCSDPGITVNSLSSLDLTRRYSGVAFDATPASRLGQPAGGGALIDRIAQVAAVFLASEQVGGAQAVLENAAQYARTRIQFGQPIGMFQAIKHQCADMLATVELAKASAYHAARIAADAWESDDSELPMASSIAKALCSEAYLDVATRYIQILGGIGFTWEHDAHLHLRRAKSSEAFLGTPSEHRAAIANRLGL